MAVERAQFINMLNELNPQPFNMIKEGDDHIRLTKGCTKNTFPRFDRKVDFSAEQLNKLYSWIMAIEDATDEEVKESLDRFTILKDMEIRRDLFFTEGGEDGTDPATPESPKISGLGDVIFTTDESNDPDLIPAEKLSRALNVRTADNRYLLKNKEGEIIGGISTLVFTEEDEEPKIVAQATEGVLTVTGELIVTEKIAAPGTTPVVSIDMETGEAIFKKISIGEDLIVSGSIFRGSDINLKWNVQNLDVALNLDDIVPVQYKKAGRKEFGVIAQELQDVPGYEHMITSGFNGVLGVDYTQFIPVLIKEVQELKAKNVDLVEEVQELKEELRNMDSGAEDSFNSVSLDMVAMHEEITDLRLRLEALEAPETLEVSNGD